MNHDTRSIKTESGAGSGTVTSYLIGFIFSVILTVEAYLAVSRTIFSDSTLVPIILILAVIQLVVQLIFFLHLGHESKPRWNFLVFVFTGLVIFIVGGGTLWIMKHLDYNMMSPTDTESFILHDEGITK